MKRLILLIIYIVTVNAGNAQILTPAGTNTGSSDSYFDREGKILIETGYTLLAGAFSGSGGTFISDKGVSAFAGAVDGGYMLTDNFAIKGKLGIFSSDGFNLYSFGAGVKYYLIQTIPIDISLGYLGTTDTGLFSSSATAGYSVSLVREIIHLEPSAGINYIDGNASLLFKLSFSLFI